MPGKNSLRLEPRPDCRFRKTCRWSWQTRECPGEERPQVSALDRCLCISCRAAPRAKNLHGGFRSPRKLPAAEFGGSNSTPCSNRVQATRLRLALCELRVARHRRWRDLAQLLLYRRVRRAIKPATLSLHPMSHAAEYCCVGAGSECPDCAYRLHRPDRFLEKEWLALVAP